MFIAKVIGSLVATQKVSSMIGHKLLVVDPYRFDTGEEKMVSTGKSLVSVDTVGAGEGEFVLVVQGSSARMTPETKPIPVDATVIGIIDTLEIEQKNIRFRD